ncbi:hypothetical protein [Endozoicomonas ascidiicola]|uniref:hypothetical protein n=1 Tax=Endozoicomonas ascidiicola TaxID=1698521 RepID=UPI00082E20BC|nr:hypothetical protein [Endozoicomonas ascidiicola]
MKKQLDNLALDFFKIFATYEFKLKEAGYFQNNRGKIIVDWDRFVNERIGSDYIDKLGNHSSSATYILDNPPMKQGIDEFNKIVWQEVSNNEKSIQILFGHISRIRNNLFHGAKFNGTWFDPERSHRLLSEALVILQHFKPSINLS